MWWHYTNINCNCFKSSSGPPLSWVLRQPVLHTVRGGRAHVLMILLNCRCLDILLSLVNFGSIQYLNENCIAVVSNQEATLNSHKRNSLHYNFWHWSESMQLRGCKPLGYEKSHKKIQNQLYLNPWTLLQAWLNNSSLTVSVTTTI